jgi:hypothetical protein
MNEQFDELVTRLKSSLGDNLVSVIVFGSAIATPGSAKKTDYQLLLVANCFLAQDLRAMRPILNWWNGLGYAIPVLFTEHEFTDSLDVFPIEFRHMKRAYRLLYGQDLLADAEVSKTNLRWQTEHELRGKLLRLRSLYPSASATTGGLTRLMTESIVSFIRLIRPILELAGQEPPLARPDTIRRAGEVLRIETAPLQRILQLREEPKELSEIEAQDLFASYLVCLTQIIEAIDKM